MKSLFITVASVFSSDDLPFFLQQLYMDDKRNVARPMLPSVSRKQSGTTRAIS